MEQAAGVDGAGAVAGGCAYHRQLAQDGGVAEVVDLAAGEDDDSHEADSQAGYAGRRELLFDEENGGEQHREQWHAGVQDGCGAAGDMLLRPGDEDERDHYAN